MDKKSFTLIEILVVIVIVGILSTLVLIASNSVVDSANDAKRKKDLDSISKMLMTYSIINGSYPSGDGDIEDVLSDDLIPDYTSSFPKDPSGSSYAYFSDGTTYIIRANLSDGQKLSYSPDFGFSQYILTEQILNGGFENGFINWTENSSGVGYSLTYVGSENWEYLESPYHYYGYGEIINRTGSNGLLLAIFGVSGGNRNHYISQTINLSNVNNINFWYKLFAFYEGPQVGSGIIRLIINNDIIWQTSVPVSSWTQANISIPPQYSVDNSVLKIEGYASCTECGATVEIYIDDISTLPN